MCRQGSGGVEYQPRVNTFRPNGQVREQVPEACRVAIAASWQELEHSFKTKGNQKPESKRAWIQPIPGSLMRSAAKWRKGEVH